ncbi:MAG: hypothetical protein IPP73_05945 [Chitinophagaceae bacterium]|nr:hypothetical protein [Chitinophagaceae bacterium]
MMQQPYKKDYLNQFYNQFFCEDYSVYISADNKPVYPFDVLASSDTAALEKIAADPDMESRIRLLAYRRLASLGIPIAEKILLGVIVEVDMEQGLDTLAVYADGSARLIGQAENMIIWEQRTKESDELISQLFNDSKNVVAMIGPWTEDRLPHPAAGEVRLNFLVSDGYYFGQGPFAVLSKDAMGGPVIATATDLLVFLVTHGEIA